MAAYSSSTRKSSGPVLRSLSPSGRFYGGASTTSFASSTASSFTNRFIHHHRASSPTCVNLLSSAGSSSSIRISIDRSTSPSRTISVQPVQRSSPPQKKTCVYSPTKHPGSFRCSLHKDFGPPRNQTASTGPYQSNRLYARRSAMTNSLVRIGTVEGDLVKRALVALIRPSSHHQRRRGDFQPRKSRLSVMSKTQVS